MNIHVLGTRGEIEPSAPRHSKHSGVLVDGSLLFDLGERQFLDYKPQAVFITHLHPDHAYFVTKSFNGNTVPIYAPKKMPGVPNLIVPTGPIKLNSHQVTPIPTHHSKLVKSTAYLIEDGKTKLLYTGDIIWVDKEYHHLFERLSLVITDGSFIRKGGMIRKDKETGQLYGHNGITDLIRLFKPFTPRILFVHFGGWFYQISRLHIAPLRD